MTLFQQAQEAARTIQGLTPLQPKIAVVLGSGLGFIESRVTEGVALSFDKIPNFRTSSVTGHAGKLVVGRLAGVPVMLFCGRIHLYEGHSAQDVAFAVKTAVLAGASTVILTNAAGSTRADWTPGQLMLIQDHLNLQGTNVLTGPHDENWGERFVDMSDPYDGHARETIKEWAKGQNLTLQEGVYAGFHGPSYETPAEVSMARTMGADAVGMSTVQETIAARQLNARVVGLSVLTNLASGVSPVPLSHAEVKETADRVKGDVVRFIEGILPIL